MRAIKIGNLNEYVKVFFSPWEIRMVVRVERSGVGYDWKEYSFRSLEG